MIRGIIFDCFGVLYVDSTSTFYEEYVTDYERLLPELQSLTKAFDYGLISGDELNTAVAELTGLDIDTVARNIRGVHARNTTLLDFGQSLRPAMKLGMLSNIGSGAIEKFFSTDERQKLFDGVVLSGEENMVKPHPHIFTLAAERLGLSPGDCIMIDDLEVNCSGADAAGMKAILYTSNAQVLRDIQEMIGTENA